MKKAENKIEGSLPELQITTNKLYVPITFKISIVGWEIPTITVRICGKTAFEPQSHQGHTPPVRFLTVLQNHRAGPKVDRRWLLNVYFERRCSRVCLASVSQVMRRLHTSVRRSRNRRQFSQVYLICTAGVSQVCRNLIATLSHVDKYARNWARTLLLNLIPFGKWSTGQWVSRWFGKVNTQ